LRTFFFLVLLLPTLVLSEDNLVIVISMDGLRHDYPEISTSGGFEFIKKNGLEADSLIPVYQSTTYPAHVSMATGVHPNKHGILHNSFFDKERGHYSYSPESDWIDVRPVWTILEEEGIKTATYFWVGSETDWNGIQITYSKFPFSSRVSETTKINQIIEWLELPNEERPQLIMTWWHGVDSVAHKLGSSKEIVKKQLLKQDKHLLDLIKEIEDRSLWDEVTLIVVSDHGMTDISNLINVKEILDAHSIEAILSLGPSIGHIFLKNLEETELAINVLEKNKLLKVLKKTKVPDYLNHPKRTGDIVITTKSPNMLVKKVYSHPPLGMHGYDPAINEEMKGIFFAYGRGVKKKKLKQVDQVDITPTILNLLGLEVPDYMDGEALLLD